MNKILKRLLISSLCIIVCENIVSLSSCSSTNTNKLQVKVEQLVLNTTNEKSDQTKSNFFKLYFNNDEIVDKENLSIIFFGDEYLKDKVSFALDDFSIAWKANINPNKYKLKWLVKYGKDEIFTPEIDFIVTNAEQNRWVKSLTNDGFWFSEHFFDHQSNIYNQNLLSASVVAINDAITYKKGDIKENGDYYIKTLMEQLNFNDYEQIGYKSETTTESIGATIAKKTLEPNYFNDGYDDITTLIYIPIRSAAYGHEWADNMFIGEDLVSRTINGIDGESYTFKTLYKNHSGFNLSAQVVINFLKLYIEKYKIKGRIKLWISGFSRGGAVANNLAGILDRAIYENNLSSFLGTSGYSLNKDDLYAYTFATPNGVCIEQSPSPQSEIYNNIFNFVDPNDLVPNLAPRQWGFTNYGITHYLGTKLFDHNYANNCKKRLKFLENQDFFNDVDNFKQYKMDGSENLKEFKNFSPQGGWNSLFSAFCDQIDRHTYVESWQSDMCEIVDGCMNGGSISDYLTQLITKITVVNNPKLISWATSVWKGEKDLILKLHSWDNYQAAAKACDPLYVSNNQDLLEVYDKYSYYQIGSRGFNYLTLTDTSVNELVFKTLDKDTHEPTIYPISYADFIETCVYSYTGYPYYIESYIPPGKYELKYSADVYGIWVDAWVKVIKISSDSCLDKILYDKHYSINPFSSTEYIENFDLK